MMSNRKPLTKAERSLLESHGWVFSSSNYIYIPDDYDGCMASGIVCIRRILEKIKKKEKSCQT